MKDRKESPVLVAGEKFGELLDSLPAGEARLPSERRLAKEWGISQAAVNRAAQKLIASGTLRRSGYRLLRCSASASASAPPVQIAVLTHRSHRYPALDSMCASFGIRAKEFFYVGRDSLRALLREVLAGGYDAVVMRLTDGGWEWDEEAAEFAAKRIPLVLGEPGPSVYPMVTEDWQCAGAMAVEKLVEAGHKELAFLGSLRRPHRSNVVERGYVETCLRLELGESAGRIIKFSSHYADNITAVGEIIPVLSPRPTACVLYDVDHVSGVMAGLAHAGLKVPSDISLVAVGDHASAVTQSPPVTCASFNGRALTRLILAEVALLVEEARSVLPALSVPRIRLEPVWRPRESVRKIGETGRSTGLDSLVVNTFSKNWSSDPAERKREIESIAREPYEAAGPVPESAFRAVPLARHVNRSITRQNSWLGHAPLSHLSPGRLMVHGVPFEILDEKQHDGKCALVLQPQHPETCNITIPVRRSVRAVYILHGCGFVGEAIPFGWYDFVLKNGRTHTIPLVARGVGALPPGGHSPNIQDWWNDFPQIEGPGFRHFVVTDPEAPLSYERYLYTLEWTNPAPKHELKEIRVSINPSLRTTLGILAVSTLDTKTGVESGERGQRGRGARHRV